MISISMRLKFLAVILIAAILVGCTAKATTLAPTATTAPTIDQQPTINAVSTQAAQTVIANLTLSAPTATPIPPTDTPAPTATITLTNTPLPPTARPTATYIPWTATPAYTATLPALNCSVTNTSPKSTDVFQPRGEVDGVWIVTNTGTSAWGHSDTDIKYISGTKMQTKGDLFDMPSDVASGASYTVVVDMLAPDTAGTYKATWAIVQGNLTICTMNLTVVVK